MTFVCDQVEIIVNTYILCYMPQTFSGRGPGKALEGWACWYAQYWESVCAHTYIPLLETYMWLAQPCIPSRTSYLEHIRAWTHYEYPSKNKHKCIPCECSRGSDECWLANTYIAAEKIHFNQADTTKKLWIRWRQITWPNFNIRRAAGDGRPNPNALVAQLKAAMLSSSANLLNTISPIAIE